MPYVHASLYGRKIFIETHMDDFHGACRRSVADPLLAELRKKFDLTESGIIVTGEYSHLKRPRVKLEDGTFIGGNQDHVTKLQDILGMQNAKPAKTPDLPNTTREGSPVLSRDQWTVYRQAMGIVL